VDVPRRVRHDHRVLAEHLHREVADVAVDELRLVVPVEDVRVEPVGRLVRDRDRVRVRVRVRS